MRKPLTLLEPMDMPDPSFPIKIHHCRSNEYGRLMFQTHWHKHLEILYFKSGAASIECNSIPFTAQTGDIVVINSNDLHSGFSLSNDLYYYALIIDPSLLHSSTFDTLETKFITPITSGQILFQNKLAADAGLCKSISLLIQEFELREPGFELSIKSELFRILTLLLRGHISTENQLDDYPQRRSNLERFYPVFNYIEEHYNEELSIALLASQVGLSRFHFSRLFKTLTGRTVTEYINGLRLNHAEYLLRNTSQSVSEIALEVGFSDIYYFSRTFKKHKQASPSEIRGSLL